MKLDPIIAVENVTISSKWYETIFNCQRNHDGNHFSVLKNYNNEVIICLHKWDKDEHPTMTNNKITPGNGLILYFRTKNIHQIKKNVAAMNWPIEKKLQKNPNSHKEEFSLRDPDGYYLTISEYHEY